VKLGPKDRDAAGAGAAASARLAPAGVVFWYRNWVIAGAKEYVVVGEVASRLVQAMQGSVMQSEVLLVAPLIDIRACLRTACFPCQATVAAMRRRSSIFSYQVTIAAMRWPSSAVRDQGRATRLHAPPARPRSAAETRRSACTLRSRPGLGGRPAHAARGWGLHACAERGEQVGARPSALTAGRRSGYGLPADASAVTAGVSTQQVEGAGGHVGGRRAGIGWVGE
jgi:hypothetical protein